MLSPLGVLPAHQGRGIGAAPRRGRPSSSPTAAPSRSSSSRAIPATTRGSGSSAVGPSASCRPSTSARSTRPGWPASLRRPDGGSGDASSTRRPFWSWMADRPLRPDREGRATMPAARDEIGRQSGSMDDPVPQPGPAIHGELRDELVRAMQRVPELAGRDLVLTALSGGITNRNFLVDAAGPTSAGSSGWPATTRTCSASAARSSTPRRSRRPASGVGPEVTAFIRPEGYLVTRFIVGLARHRRGGPPARDAAPRRRFAPPDPRRPGDPRPVRPAPDRRGVPGAGAERAASPSRPAYDARGGRSAGGSSWRCCRTRSSSGHATTTCSTRTSSTTARGSGSSTGSTPGWVTRSSTSATSASTTS